MLVSLKKFFKRDRKSFVLGIDLGTEAIKVGLFLKDKKNLIPQKTSFCFYNFPLPLTTTDWEKEMLKSSLKECFRKIKKENFKDVSTFVIFPPNILREEIIFEVFKRKEKKEITSTEEKLIIEDVLKNVQKRVSSKELKEKGILPQELFFLKKEILEIKIDGYEVPRLKGYKGKELSFKVFVAFLPYWEYQRIKDSFSFFQIKNFSFFFPVVSLKNIFSQGLFLDIGGEITCCYLIKDRKIEKIWKFNFGGEDFEEKLKEEFGISSQDARILIEKHTKNQLSESGRKRISEIVSEVADKWFFVLRSSLAKYEGIFPSKVYIFGGGGLIPEIQEILENGDWKDVKFFNEIEVKKLSFKTLKFDSFSSHFPDFLFLNLFLKFYEKEII